MSSIAVGEGGEGIEEISGITLVWGEQTATLVDVWQLDELHQYQVVWKHERSLNTITEWIKLEFKQMTNTGKYIKIALKLFTF